MATFLKHTSCPACGSSDARGLYSDGGSFCFSCKAKTSPSFVVKMRHGNIPPKEGKALPDNLSTHFEGKAIQWLTQYGFSVEDLIKHGVRYANNWVYFTWPNLSMWQGRDMAVKRYYTSGSHTAELPVYYSGVGSSRCVLTEDCLSAIKIATCGRFTGLWSDAMPLLGTHLPSVKIRALRRLYDTVDVFLDHDKGKEAMKLSGQLKLLGMKSRVFINKLDPKEITYDSLAEILK